MENLPTWPDTVFLENSILEMDKTGLPSQAKTKEFKSTVSQWKKDREETLHDIEAATEIVQMGLENATEFLKYKTLSEPRVLKLKKQCEDHDNRMDEITSDLITYRSTNFIKKYSLSPGAKENIKEEFQRLTKHIKLNQKCIHSELARILEEKEKQEVKPVTTEAPAAQPSGSATVVEVQHDPMNS